MLEHIFRNINDIRVFDVFYIEYCDGEEIDIHEILESLEYKEIEYIQIEDSVKHLVKCKILEKVYNKLEGYTGCRICSYFDKIKLPRIGEHKSHKQFEKVDSYFPYYKLADNDMITYLFKSCFEYIQLYYKDIENNNRKIDN